MKTTISCWVAFLAASTAWACTSNPPALPGQSFERVSGGGEVSPQGAGVKKAQSGKRAPNRPNAGPAEAEQAPPQAAVLPRTAYDLDADVARWKTRAQADFGEVASVEVVADVFVISGPGRKGSLKGTNRTVERALEAYTNDRFGRLPARAVGVYLFPSAKSYDAFCRRHSGGACVSVYGFYMPSQRLIVMNIGLGVGTLTHELVHPIVETDFPEAPDWIDEGTASLFEAFGFTKGGIRGYKNWRHPRLLRAVQSKQDKAYAGLPTLFGMSDAVFRGENEALHYAMARYLCQWLDSRGQLWPFYQAWRDNYATDPTGEKAFRVATGMTPAEASPEWQRWVKRL